MTRSPIELQDGGIPYLARCDAWAERFGLSDAGREQLEPGAQTFLALSAIGPQPRAGRTDAQCGECLRPSREITYLLKTRKARPIMNYRDTLT